MIPTEEKEMMRVGHLVYCQGRALACGRRLEVADFYDIVALAYYGESEESIHRFIAWRMTTAKVTVVPPEE